MDSVELYSQLLGLKAPWTVHKVDLDVASQEVQVHVGHQAGQRFACPRCKVDAPVYDHVRQRRWRHLDSCQFLTFLVAEPPRVHCPEHGVNQVELPWAEAGGRFTSMFEALAIEVLLGTNIKHAAHLLRITWDEAWGVMQRAVKRGLATKKATAPELIGVDEKAIAKGHRYMTLVCDLQAGTVEHVEHERTHHSLASYFLQLDEERLHAVQAVCLDMWQSYIGACQTHVPGAKLVFDRFHIMKHMLDAVDRVRRTENKTLMARGDATLARSRYLWLYSAENVPDKSRQRFQQLKHTELKTARAWAIKEALRQLWDYRSAAWAEKFFKRWYFWASHSRLPQVIRVARMLKSHWYSIVTYFDYPITNAVVEGLNSKIASIHKRSCGIRNPEHFRIAVFFHCGGLNLAPLRS